MVGYYKQNLKDHSNRSLEDSSAEGNVDCQGQTQEVSGGNNISKWSSSHSCDSPAKNLAAFCPCPKNLPDTKLKSNRLLFFLSRGYFKTA